MAQKLHIQTHTIQLGNATIKDTEMVSALATTTAKNTYFMITDNSHNICMLYEFCPIDNNTWSNWVYSNYNTDRFYINSDKVWYNADDHYWSLKYEDGSDVVSTDLVESKLYKSYDQGSMSGGGGR